MQAAVSPETMTAAAAASSSISTLRSAAILGRNACVATAPTFRTLRHSRAPTAAACESCGADSISHTAKQILHPRPIERKLSIQRTVSPLNLELCAVMDANMVIFCVCCYWDGLRCLIDEKKCGMFKSFYFWFENGKYHVDHLFYSIKFLIKYAGNFWFAKMFLLPYARAYL